MLADNLLIPLVSLDWVSQMQHEDLLSTLCSLQWTPRHVIKQLQIKQIKLLTEFAQAHTPYYKDNNEPLTREHINKNPGCIISDVQLQSHGPTYAAKTSGSTGTPVNFRLNNLTHLIQTALNERLIDVLRLPRSATRLSVLHGLKETDTRPWNSRGGQSVNVSAARSITAIVSKLNQVRPEILTTHPSILRSLLLVDGIPDSIDYVTTLGEATTKELRDQMRSRQIQYQDVYSAKEVGIIAVECLHNPGHYHIQEESVDVQIVDENNQPVPSGVSGKVLITSLNNFSTPFILYEIGDYATMATSDCDCGRTQRLLTDIRGRTRNMQKLPNGDCRWPHFTIYEWLEGTPIYSLRVIQHQYELYSLMIKYTSTPTEDDLEKLTKYAYKHLGAGLYTVHQDSVQDFDKHEDFKCMF